MTRNPAAVRVQGRVEDLPMFPIRTPTGNLARGALTLADVDRLLAGGGTLDVTERWRAGASRFRPAHETFDPRRYGVEVLDARPAQEEADVFVRTHHYAASVPPVTFRAGLFETDAGPGRSATVRPRLVGAALFTVPVSEATVPKYAPVLGPREGVELGRFVLLDDVKAMAETWFLARAFRALRAARPELGVVVSYSDPVPKHTLAGDVVMPGHVGLIYQAHNARYVGRTKPETFWQDARGRDLAPRTLSKIRNEERGAEAAARGLVARGAPPRRPHESLRDWLSRALAEGPFRRYRHPGKHAYAWGLGRRRAEVEASLPAAQPYPKRERP